jgi:two-component system, LytTR family, sensor kinase
MLPAVHIPKYTTKDFHILVASMLPMALMINYVLYGSRYFTDISCFLPATLLTFFFLGVAFLTYGFVAIFLRNRFPSDGQVFKRLTICISIFVLMSAVYVSILLLSYDYFHFLGYEYDERDFVKIYVTLIVVNIFLTFLNEGVYRFEKYRATITETQQLKKEYIHSQLLGLKSQMNPHFLFNSLNTLSSLINENPEKAEDFLDHMSKVYRYLLRNNEEQLVSVETEINFISSYYYLLQARHGEGLQLELNIPEPSRELMIPPLTLQMIIENIIYQNSISRSKPLMITIRCSGTTIELINNVQPKINMNDDSKQVLENISNKFRLLCQKEPVIRQDEKHRIIQLPLISKKELAVL